MALIVLDTSVVIGHLNPADALHAGATAAFAHHADDELVLPASAYAEALVDATRVGRATETRSKIDALMIRIAPIDEAVAEKAAEIRAVEDGLRLPDALVLGCADVLGADAVLTANRRWQRFPRVKLIA